MRFTIIALLLVALVGCIYPFFTNASALAGHSFLGALSENTLSCEAISV